MEHGRMIKRRPRQPLNPQIRAEATEWLLRFSEGEVDTAGREEFNYWLRTSPEHVHAYLRVAAFWQEAERLDGKEGERDIEALVAQAKNEANVFPFAFGRHDTDVAAGHGQLLTEAPRTRSFPGRRRASLAVAAILVATIGALGAYQHLTRNIYETRIGEQRTVNLPDGSTLILNADSRVKVRYSDTARTIDLDEGQALFKVARNPALPFIVRSGETSVRAVGTQFDVYRRTTGTTVTVLEGSVAVRPLPARPRASAEAPHRLSTHSAEPVLLSAGEQLTIPQISVVRAEIPAPGDTLPKPRVRPVKVEEASAWTAGLLIFDGAPLADVVQEFNRHNTRRLVLDGGAELSQLKISGTFPANGSERITRFLQERFGVVVHETDDAIKLSRR